MSQIRHACPYLGKRFLPYFSHFWVNLAEMFCRSSGDYRLVMNNTDSNTYFLIFNFLTTFGGKIGVANPVRP